MTHAPSPAHARLARALAAALALSLAPACGPPSAADLDGTRGGRVEVFFNEPGTRPTNEWDPDAVAVMIDLINGANSTLDFAVMGFGEPRVVAAMVAAWDRGVELRMVGDAGHIFGSSGYDALRDRQVPMSIGNMPHIMHNKFMVVDGRFVFCGTANWTESDLIMNSNNFVMMDSPAVAADFTAEFEQLYSGLFGNNKIELDNGRTYQLGDTEVEVWFSPNEDAMGRMREYLNAAQESVRFTIFAFTKNEVGSDMVRKQAEFRAQDIAEGIDPEAWAGLGYADRRSVAGVIDQSQLHSNGQYHEVYRLLGAGIPIRLDGNDNTMQPGDYQAGGGRLHSKTMLMDTASDNPVVVTGSFNWSASATQSNDEYLLVLKSPRIAKLYDNYFDELWGTGRSLGYARAADGSVREGDVVINEVMWYGAHSGDAEGFDEFIELRNTTDRPIQLDMWQITNSDDVIVGLPPGSTIPANGTFLIVDHVLETYVDGAPQDENTAYLRGDLVVSTFNDNRQSRLYLKDGSLELILRDPDGVELDRAGDGGPAFAGGPSADGETVRSMERSADPGDGADRDRWHAFSESVGRGAVNPDYAAEILASPDEANSAP